MHGLHLQHTSTSQRSCTATRVTQQNQLSTNQQHLHLIEIKCCEGTRPGQRLKAAQQQHADPCKNIIGKALTLHTILLDVGCLGLDIINKQGYKGKREKDTITMNIP
eukprot:1026058-Pelagomonas_calceolata.AAC.1